jgi:predicted cation transporter
VAGWGGFGSIVQTGNEPARVMQGALKLTFWSNIRVTVPVVSVSEVDFS